ncbi:MAG: APC family permease [Armatimonadota bacterium]|nr:APC family permease [Armatimonadota bacterium]
MTTPTILQTPSGETTAAALEEKGKLQTHFGRKDVFFFLICTLVGLDTIGAVSKSGAQGFTWLAFLGVFFFIPYALLTAELGSSFTEEGGPYVWARLAFGRPIAAVSALLYWVSNPIWLGGTLTISALTAIGAFFHPLKGFEYYLFALVFIWGTVLAAVLSFRIGKWIPIIGAWARLIVLPFFTFTVILYAARHGVHGFSSSDFKPTYAAFIALTPVILFNYVGFELPSAAGEEMKDPRRDIPFAVARSAIGALLLYGVPILSILLVLPKSQVTGLSGFLDAIKVVFTVYGGAVGKGGAVTLSGWGQWLGEITCIAFILALASSGATWIMGADRTEAVAAFDGAGPRILGRFSRRFGTPVVVNLLSGAISTVVMALASWYSGGNVNKYFDAGLGLVISTTTISYLAVFPALAILRRTYPEVNRPYRVPGGSLGALICSVVVTAWCALSTVALIWPGFGVGSFGTTGKPDDSLPSSFSHHRMDYELSQIIPLLFFVGLGILFYWMGRDTRRRL